jgi:23S rRNA (cytosine1962-C5)-methyltransferase
VWSEADLLPGLVIDRYAAVVVLQCATLGMARRRADVASAVRAVVGDRAIFCADETSPARLEGFEPARGWLDRTGPVSAIGTGHKTGLYLDQAENRVLAGTLAAGRAILDAFSYAGGFAIHALLGGARHVVAIESSIEAAAQASANVALNGVAERAEIVTANAFDELRRLQRQRSRFGLIILDPPPFARGRDVLDAARRGYKEINLRAMRLLEPGGHLLTFSCSHHVTGEVLEEICREAAADSGLDLRVTRELGQSRDHPVLLGVPETRYLRGLLLQAV